MRARRANTRLAAAAIAVSAQFATALASEDRCAAILNGGVHNVTASSRTVVVENTAKRYICSHRMQAIGDAKALELGFMIRFLGVRIGISKDKVNEWVDANCSDHSTTDKSATQETTYTRNADKALADAWLRCKTLEFKANGIGVTEEVGATDRSGRPYKFRIALIGMTYNWDKASTTTVLHQRRPFDILAQLRSREWLETVGDARDVFAVGTASCGGTGSIEVERALARANQLRAWIDVAHRDIGRPPARGTINLGKFQDEFCSEGSPVSDMQRPIAVLIVTEQPPQTLRATDYQSALIDAATAHPAFQFHRYSNFDIALR